MSTSEAMEIMHSASLVAVKIAGPILLVSIVIGLIVSIIQAATQVNEQTLTFVPKLIAIGVILLVFGPWMLETLADFTHEIFNLMLI